MHGNENILSEIDCTRILEQRARELATAKKSILQEENQLDFVEFMIAGEYYGIELQYIREVYALKKIACLPGVPAFIAGIINLRGTIVSVVDLRIFFGAPGDENQGKPHVIILTSEQMEFGILADMIVGVRKLPASALQPPITTLTGARARYLKGIVDSRIALLNGRRILEDENLRVGGQEDA